MNMTKTNVIIGLIIVLLVVIAASALKAWYSERKKPAMSKIEYIKVPEIREIVKIKKINVPGPKEILTIEKEKIVEKLRLPNWFAQNADEQAIATAEVPPYEGCTDIVCALNTKTGEGKIIAKQKPLPVLALESKTEFYLKSGISSRGDYPLTAGVHRRLLRMKSVHMGVYGEGTVRLDAGTLGQPETVAGVIIYW